MERKLIITADGSHTIGVGGSNLTFHSIHGAIQESRKIFLEAGFSYPGFDTLNEINILEMGFGTGLNALLTLIQAKLTGKKVYYEALEMAPLEEHLFASLNYCTVLDEEGLQDTFIYMHRSPWERAAELVPGFILLKKKINILDYDTNRLFDLVYFDAFAPSHEPGVWSNMLFSKMFSCLASGGVLVTFSSSGDVRRNLQAAGFMVEKLPGPKGKREFIRAIKL
jgi:tRNA U34 5-methylaminomethyl-2-thiouridine-forming methyltransferase MnmC